MCATGTGITGLTLRCDLLRSASRLRFRPFAFRFAAILHLLFLFGFGCGRCQLAGLRPVCIISTFSMRVSVRFGVIFFLALAMLISKKKTGRQGMSNYDNGYLHGFL